MALLAQVEQVHAAKGKIVLHFDLRHADVNEVLAAILGPTGNLRAPAFRKQKTLVVGFNEATYHLVLD